LDQHRDTIDNFKKMGEEIQSSFVPEKDPSKINLTEPERVDLQTV